MPPKKKGPSADDWKLLASVNSKLDEMSSKKLTTTTGSKVSTAPAQKVVIEKEKFKSKIPRSVVNSGPQKVVQMKYVREFEMDTGALPTENIFYAENDFRLNSINRPYVGQGVGMNLPYGHQSATLAYDRYKVLGCKIKISGTFEDTSPAGTDTGIIAAWVQPSSMQVSGAVINLNGANYEDLSSTPYVRFRTCTRENTKFSFKPLYLTIRQIEGLSKTEFAGDYQNYSAKTELAVANANTNEQDMKCPILKVGICNPENGNQLVVSCKVELTYYVKLSNRKYVAITDSA